MTLVIADSAPPAQAGISRQQLLHRIGLLTGLLQTGTVTAGAVNYFEDNIRLQSQQYSPSDWKGGWARISQTTDNNAPESEYSPINKYEPELGRVTVSPPLTVAPDAGDLYELWRVDPVIILDIIDNALTEELYEPCWSILSEVPDFDMEQTGTTYWTGANSTLSKQTTGVRLSNYGKQYLRVVSTAANGYAESITLNVEPGKSYHASVVARTGAASTTAKLQVYDKTNSTVLASITTNHRNPLRLIINVTVPNNCYQISLRLVSVESGVTTEWAEACFYCTASDEISAPWWVDRRDAIRGVFQLVPYGVGGDKWDPTLKGEQDFGYDIIPHKFGQAKYIVKRRAGVITWPLFIYGLRHETAYSDDNTDVKYIDSNLFTSCIKYKIYEYLSQPLVTGVLQSFDVKSKLPLAEKEYHNLLRSEQNNLNQILGSYTPRGVFSNPKYTFGAQ